MTPMTSTMGMKEGCSDHEERLLQTPRQAFRDGSHRLVSRQLHKAGIQGYVLRYACPPFLTPQEELRVEQQGSFRGQF